jgi:L-erythro-3,5-diaminohexanoate dehydrogenase
MSKVYDNEIRIAVETLNVDSASFTQIKEQAGGDEKRIGEIVMDTVKRFGKQQNPVTGSGGVLIGRVESIGSAIADKIDLKPGDEIVTLVSLSLTPLHIEEVLGVRPKVDQVDVRGTAVLFEHTGYAKIPSDINKGVTLAVLDVAGAAPQAHKLVKPGDTVCIIGAAGKSGMLCSYQARKDAGPDGMVIGLTSSPSNVKRMEELGLCHKFAQADASKPLEVEKIVRGFTGGKMADVTINCTNVPGTEMASIMATKDDGVVYYFGMATSFTRAALGAEGICHDATMIIGNGYTKKHADFSLNLMRESELLTNLFEKLYG